MSTKAKKTHILVSGFKKFPNTPSNPSEHLAKYLETKYLNHPAIKVTSITLDTNYKTGYEQLNRKILSCKPDAIIAFGVNASSERIHLETTARNQVKSKPDFSGYRPKPGNISPDGAPTIRSSLPLPSLKRALVKADIPVRQSKSAGFYVCNDLFYRLMEDVENGSITVPAGFVHIPADEKLAACFKKTNHHYMPLETINNAGCVIIEAIALKH